MTTTGYLRDLVAALADETQVTYQLELDTGTVDLMAHMGETITLEHTGEKSCVWCGRKVKKLFPNGSCYPCFRDLPQNDLCVVRPHTCHYETCRDQSWGDAHCMIPTYLYLAKSSDIKVGITRNLPGRWLDQGAVEAVPIALLPNRKMAGELEYHLTQHLPDKTNWRKMLKSEVSEASLEEVRRRVLELIPEEYRAHLLPEQEQVHRAFAYPIPERVETIASANLDKGPVTGTLIGIKARYLILSPDPTSGKVQALNIPKFAGYRVKIDFGNAQTVPAGA